jgi:hypothetical protein
MKALSSIDFWFLDLFNSVFSLLLDLQHDAKYISEEEFIAGLL